MAYKNVLLKGDPIMKEALAAGAITPGHLIKLNGSGAYVVHSTSGGAARRLFAMEMSDTGKDIDDAYASGDTVYGLACRPGDEVYAILDTSQTIVEGDALESGGNGRLIKYSAGVIVAWALEDKTTTSAVARIIVEVA